MERIKHSDTENFIRSILFCFGAPTIKGLKASCLINFRRHKHEDMRSSWKFNASKWLSPLGVEWLLLNEHENKNLDSALVLIYRRELLIKILECNKACEILKSKGYPLNNIDACLNCLSKKFCPCLNFPHEIGLFLDYPPDDVKSFIEDKEKNISSKNLLQPGYWKVYSNVRKARRIFRKYKRAEYDAARLILMGK